MSNRRDYSKYNWKDNKLYLGRKDTGFSIFNAEEDLYWMKWPDGTVSADYYNLSRAKDHCIRQAQGYAPNNGLNGL